MKNKKLTYLLIPAVFLIWGLIIYRIVVSHDPSPEIKFITEKSNQQEQENKEKNENLILDYPDPFLKSLNNYSPNDRQQSKIIDTYQKKNGNKNKEHPEITYWGMIENKEKKEMTINIRIEKKDYLMKIGHEIEGIELLNIKPDSILVSYKDQLLVVKKN